MYNLKPILSLAVILSSLFISAQKNINHYQRFLGIGAYKNQTVIVLRQFEQKNKPFYLIVSPDNLETQIIPAKKATVKQANWSEIATPLNNSTYIKAMAEADKDSYSLQDSGISHGYPKAKGITLTIDLCPSHKPLDRVIFNSIISEFKKIEQPVPVALSVSGKFLLTHQDDIEWLKHLERKNEITVTWINHTYNHHYDPKLPLVENFLLEPHTDIDFEILGTEMAMIEHGLLPSVFFRFPGLISSHQMVEKVTQYGLIPIGSDAWLAKGQNANSGSIVLIHGNGNEPLGVKDFIKLLQNEKDSVLKKQWLMYDLRDDIKEEVKTSN